MSLPLSEHLPTLSLRPGDGRMGEPLRAGQRIGDFEIIEELARGGMGIVFKARQTSLKRIVALKMVLRGDLARFEDLVRFESEAHAVARLHHPNLVSIYETGELGGLPYFAMEFLEGGSLAQRLLTQTVEPRTAARLILNLARAIDYAHTQGIVHRDLKPANILLTDEQPLDTVCAKITDFGIAKCLDDANNLTRTGEILGTPCYMAPEQALGRQETVGPAADIYSFGAILYELLTGRPPILASDVTQTLLGVLNNDPPAPRRLKRTIPADLETICLKCLERDPTRRYSSAGLLAEDLRRFLTDEPILARPASAFDRARKWVRRRPVTATALIACALMSLLGWVGSLLLWRQAEGRASAEAMLRSTEEAHAVETGTLLAETLLERGIALANQADPNRGLHWMVRALERADPLAAKSPRAAAIAEAIRYNLAHWSEETAPPETDLPHPTWAWAVAFSPDGTLAATGCRDGRVRLWDAIAGQGLAAPLHLEHSVWAVRFHPKGQFLLAGTGDEQHGTVSAFVADPDRRGAFRQHGVAVRMPGSVVRIEMDPTGRFVLARTRAGKAILCEFASDGPAAGLTFVEDLGACAGGQFMPDGKSLILAQRSGVVSRYDIQTRTMAEELWRLEHPLTALALSPDGARLAVATYDSEEEQATVYEGKPNAERPRKRPSASTMVKELVYNPTGEVLAASFMLKDRDSFLGQVRLYAVELEGDEPALTLGHPKPVWAMAFSPDGNLLLTGCEDRHSRFFEVGTGMLLAPPMLHQGNVTTVAITGDGLRAITASSGGDHYDTAKLQHLPQRRSAARRFGVHRALTTVQWHHQGQTLFGLDEEASVVRLDGRTGRHQRTLLKRVEGYNHTFANSRFLVTFSDASGGMTLTDLETEREVFRLPDSPGHIHEAHGQHIAGILPLHDRAKRKLRLYSLDDSTQSKATIPQEHSPTNFSAADAAGNFGQPIIAAAVPVYTRNGSGGIVHTSHEVCIWDVNLAQLQRWTIPYRVHYASLSPRGQWAVIFGTRQLAIYDPFTGKRVGREIPHPGQAQHGCFHPTEPLFGCANPDRTVTFRHLPTGLPVGRSRAFSEGLAFLSARPDGSGFLCGSFHQPPVEWSHLGPMKGTLAEIREAIQRRTGGRLDATDELVPTHP